MEFICGAEPWFWLSASDVGNTPGNFTWMTGPEVDKTFWDDSTK